MSQFLIINLMLLIGAVILSKTIHKETTLLQAN